MMEEKRMEEIKCLWCFKGNTFIDGKCNFCNGHLNVSYNINIISTLIVGIVFFVVAAIMYTLTELSYSTILGGIFRLIAFGCLCATCYFIKRKKTAIIISKENTRLKYEELKLKSIEAEELYKQKKEEEQQKRILEQEKIKEYEIKKENLKEKYIEIMLEKPEILQTYEKILKENCNIDSVFKKYSNNYFKIVFWDFLLGEVKDKKFNLLYSEFLRNIHGEKDFITLDLEYLHSCYTSGRLLKTYLKTGKVTLFKEYSYRNLNYHENCIYAYVTLIKDLFNFYKIIDEFENNKELFQIYNNMKEAKIDKEIIVDKIYSLYKNLYLSSFNKVLDENDIEMIIELENKKLMLKKYDHNYLDISSKSQLSKFIVDELSETSDEEKIVCIANIVKAQKHMDKRLKFDIIVNIDDILNKSRKQIENYKKQVMKQKEILNAKKERDRLLKGDLSTELKTKKLRQELELDTNKIKNGFEFEDYVANLYSKLGYKIEKVTKKSGDQGADVVAIQNDTKYVIQAKFYNSPVGNKAVQEVVAAIGMYKADKGIVITNNSFTQSAIELAKANSIELVDGKKIEEFKKRILAKI